MTAIVAGAAATTTIAAIILYHFPPETCSQWYPTCPSRHFFHLYCPGCGSTRMFAALVHGDLIGAFRKNPLALLLLPILIYFAAVELGHWIGLRLPCRPIPGWSIYLLLAIILAYGIARNLPCYPLTLLRPH